MIFKQKIIQIGNSYGVIIPRALANYLGWKQGTLVDLSYSSSKKSIVIKDMAGRGLRITKEIDKKKSPNG